MSTGSGDDTVTYYVADVQLTEGTDLESAFSNGSYGGKAQDTSTMAEANNAIVAINGDYYSARDDGIIIRNGVIYRDVPARTGLAIYKDGTMKVYDETTTSAEELLADGVWNTYSFGPGLLVDGQVAERARRPTRPTPTPGTPSRGPTRGPASASSTPTTSCSWWWTAAARATAAA